MKYKSLIAGFAVALPIVIAVPAEANINSKTATPPTVKITLKDNSTVKNSNLQSGKLTYGQYFKDSGLKISDFRTSTYGTINPNESIKSSGTFYRLNTGSSEQTINIPIPVVTKLTPTLNVGTEQVQNNGSAGKGLQTTVTTTLATLRNSSKSTSNLIITTAPSPKVILVGTNVPQLPGATTYSSVSTGDPGTKSNVGTGVVLNWKNIQNLYPTPSFNNPSAAVVKLALAQVGKPYIAATQGPDSFDCSGLVWYIYSTNLGYSIPRTAAAQGAASVPVSLKDIQPGDILWTTHHVGIYIGNGQVVSAANPEMGVHVTPIAPYWIDGGFQIGRLIPPASKLNSN